MTLTWIGILLCLTQAGVFSGLNLAFFAVSRVRLQAEADQGNPDAISVLRLRSDSNLLLATILWGNTSVNVLLALLSESVLPAVGAFLFSTVGITLFGEILPQAYFSKQALKFASLFTPLIHFYRFVFFPVAKPTALTLDKLIGREGIWYFREKDLEAILSRQILQSSTDIGAIEGRGALNFLRLDDLIVAGEGSPLDPDSVFPIQTSSNQPIFPGPDSDAGQRILKQLHETNRKWIVFVNEEEWPTAVLNADEFLREFHSTVTEPTGFTSYVHPPIVIIDPKTPLDAVLSRLSVEPVSSADRILDREVILYWGKANRRIITGPDILGSLLHGIAHRTASPPFQ